MKRCLLSLAAAACLFLASCSFQSGSELLDSSLLAAPVPEELTQSELWQQAVHSGSLISYEEEPITTKAMAEEATASLAKKGGTVEIYQFSGSAIPPPAPGFSAKTPARRSPSPEVKHRTGSPPPNRNRPIPSLSPSSPAMGSSPPRPAAARTLASGR